MGKIRKYKECSEVEFDLKDLFTRPNPLPWWMFLYAQNILKDNAPAEYERIEKATITLEGDKVVASFFYTTK